MIVSAPSFGAAAKKAKLLRVAYVIDGDTIAVSGGKRVRLVQIDAPESPENECYGLESKSELERLLPTGTKVRLAADPALDARDRYGRLLRYVFKGKMNVNLELVRRGAATVWFYDGDRGRYADALLGATQTAMAAGRGLWGACPGTPFDTSQGADTGTVGGQPPGGTPAACADGIDNDGDGKIDYPADPGCGSAADTDERNNACADGIDNDGDGRIDYPNDPGCASAGDDQETTPSYACDDGSDNDGDGRVDYPDDPDCSSPTDTSESSSSPPPPSGSCDPSYPTVCIPPPPPDLDCGDITFRNFTVVGSDPHRFDVDGDGVGCES